MPTPTANSMVRCQNVKSQKEREERCKATAIHGGQCGRHSKNPTPFREPPSTEVVTRIQRFWRRHAPLYHFRHQGPAQHLRSIATNETELFSLEPLDSIPKMQFISVSDESRSIQGFDLRSLTPLLQGGSPQNPQTRREFSSLQMEKLQRRIEWFHSRKIPSTYPKEEGLTESQIWNQKVIEVFQAMEEHGYLVQVDWFHGLGTQDQKKFYRELQDIWFWRAGLTHAERDTIVEDGGSQENPLFYWTPRDPSLDTRSLTWWKKQNLERIRRMVSTSSQKDQRALGVMQVLMALVQVSEGAAEALPWIYDSVQ